MCVNTDLLVKSLHLEICRNVTIPSSTSWIHEGAPLSKCVRYTDIRDFWFGTSHWRSFQVWYSKVGIIMLRVESLEMSLWLKVWMKICKWEVGKEFHDHSTRFPDWKSENAVDIQGNRETNSQHCPTIWIVWTISLYWVYPDISKTMRWLNITELQLGEVEFIGYDDMIIVTVIYLSINLSIKLYLSNSINLSQKKAPGLYPVRCRLALLRNTHVLTEELPGWKMGHQGWQWLRDLNSSQQIPWKHEQVFPTMVWNLTGFSKTSGMSLGFPWFPPLKEGSFFSGLFSSSLNIEFRPNLDEILHHFCWII